MGGVTKTVTARQLGAPCPVITVILLAHSNHLELPRKATSQKWPEREAFAVTLGI